MIEYEDDYVEDDGYGEGDNFDADRFFSDIEKERQITKADLAEAIVRRNRNPYGI